jgi:dual specificity phosphatase 12
MGKSRSATLATAYLLATRPTTCPDVPSALSLIRESRPGIEPNDGFMEQLTLYHTLNCPPSLDVLESLPTYQRWLYAREVELSTAIGRAPDRLRFEDEEHPSSQADNVEVKTLRCRKCRTLLGTSEYFVPHEPKIQATISESATAALPLPNPHAAERNAGVCGHFFIQPLSWMRPALEMGELAGRLACPNKRCEAGVGRWSWQGIRCSCGVWVTPAFSIQAGRVDLLSAAVERGRGQKVAGVRMPPGQGNL